MRVKPIFPIWKEKENVGKFPVKCWDLADLFLEDWVVGQDVVGVEIPQPVGEDHREGEGEEDDEGRGEERVAAVQQAHHGDCQHDAQRYIQVPTTVQHHHSIYLQSADRILLTNWQNVSTK